ncbi:MAG: hypothetical protein FJZ38_11605 [Candidatus Rokubacteria bacterium]|nr:hypothetical protein [Candidatus Rokubacteria bacterium]
MGERTIRITAGEVAATATLDASKTADAIWNALPIEAKASTWGDEIYFDVGLAIAAESPKEVVALGDLGYWPPGSAFCIFFGRTPVSTGNEIRPASAVNVFGRVAGDPTVFKTVRSGIKVKLERAETRKG